MRKRYALSVYTAGATVARTGDEMSGPALLLAGLAVTGSTATASSLLAAVLVSAAAGGPVLGVLLDRSAAPGRLLAGALAGYAAALVAVLLCLGRAPVAVTLLIAAAAGLLGPALSGGWTAQLPRVVPSPGALPRATALDAMTFNAASLAGPALAGLIAGLYGAHAGVLTSVALICLALPSALALPLPRARGRGRGRADSERSGGAGSAATGSPGASGTSGATRVLGDLAAGFRVIGRNRPLARATLTSVISSAGAGALVVCAPALGARDLGSGDRGALLLAGVAAVSLGANAVLARLPLPRQPRPDTVLWCGALVLAVAFLLAAAGGPVLLAGAVVLAGIAEGPQLTALFAVRHREAPERLRGQIFTTGASLKITGFAVGAALAGPLAERSLAAALTAAALCELLAVAAYGALRGAGAGPGPRSPECRSTGTGSPARRAESEHDTSKDPDRRRRLRRS
ncbi:MFS transporter [Streptomyces paludis]|uniref:MFS transporter n=1 Tax=Streptomyces paludis TaxID=2282738 RepID=UPI001E435446|nr:MFS transporter [Streptomyces paludis]